MSRELIAADLSLPYQPPPQENDSHELFVPANLLIIGIGQGVESWLILLPLNFARVGAFVILESEIYSRGNTYIQSCPAQEVPGWHAHVYA